MSREIKFRAWLIGSERMLDDVTPEKPDSEAHAVVEYMQFTGLQDKNGRDIYEGDIVRYQTESNSHLGVIEHGTTVIIWRHAGIEFHLWDMDPNNMEVIGNIYENPELLSEATR